MRRSNLLSTRATLRRASHEIARELDHTETEVRVAALAELQRRFGSRVSYGVVRRPAGRTQGPPRRMEGLR